jgi:hypothetical protein
MKEIVPELAKENALRREMVEVFSVDGSAFIDYMTHSKIIWNGNHEFV